MIYVRPFFFMYKSEDNMADQPNIIFDVDDFRRDVEALSNREYPAAMAAAMRATTRTAAANTRLQTENVFDLRSDYITKAIKNTPETNSQMKKAARGFVSHGDLNGTVYLRPGSGKRDMSFMLPHETGGTKRATGGVLAVPAEDIENYSYRTSRGAVKKRYKPETMLAQYNSISGKTGGNIAGSKITGKNKKMPFLKESPMTGATQIVRRKTKDPKSLQVLYTFKKEVKVNPAWEFEKTVRVSVESNYESYFSTYINRVTQ